MPVMSAIEGAFCRSGAWRSFARRVDVPWGLGDQSISGDMLEIGGGSGAMADGVARTHTEARLVVTDVDDAMVRTARALLGKHANVTVEQADAPRCPSNRVGSTL